MELIIGRTYKTINSSSTATLLGIDKDDVWYRRRDGSYFTSSKAYFRGHYTLEKKKVKLTRYALGGLNRLGDPVLYSTTYDNEETVKQLGKSLNFKKIQIVKFEVESEVEEES